MKSHGFDELGDGAIDTLLEWDAKRPTPQTLTAIRALGGAIERVADAESAFPHRADRFNVSIDTVWSRPADDAKVIGWARGAWDALARDASGGVYVNFAGLEGEAGASADRVFRLSRNRLAEVRAAYDPTGLFELAARRP